MIQTDPIVAELMAPGAPFEVMRETVSGREVNVFKHAPATLTAVINKARQFGSAEFIVSGDRRLSFDDVFAAADRLAAWLVSNAGIKPGQSVALCMKNSPEWMIAFIAIINAGGVAVLINSRGTGPDMAQAVLDADCVFIIGDDRRMDLLRSQTNSAVYRLPYMRAADIMGVESGPIPPVERVTDDIAAMFFTSGTTGRAKAAAITHRSLVTGTLNTQMAMAAVFIKMAQAYGVDVETLRARMPQSCSLLVFPLFHTSGCSAVFLTSLIMGGKLVMMERWDAQDALALIEHEKITTFGGVPTMHWDILRAENLDQHDLSSLMALSVGGQALPLNLLEQIRARFPKVFIGIGYGMTETSGAIAQANGEAFLKNPKASGQILPMVDVQITGENGEALAVGEIGEIWMKGATLMAGYHNRPIDTAEAMNGDWFKTGDIGKVDDDGYIYIIDRKTDMVISGGENIYCAEVEQILSQHPHILQVSTFGVPDERLGERLIATIVTDRSQLTENDVLKFARQHMASYKIPSDIVLRSEPMAFNAMGKVEKQGLRRTYLTMDRSRQAS